MAETFFCLIYSDWKKKKKTIKQDAPGSVEGHLGPQSEQSGLVEGAPTQGRGWNEMILSNPNHSRILQFSIKNEHFIHWNGPAVYWHFGFGAVRITPSSFTKT